LKLITDSFAEQEIIVNNIAKTF